MNLGKAIKDARDKLNMTQSQLADRCSMSSMAISMIETGKTFPPKNTLEKICEAFGVSMATILLASIEEGDFPPGKKVLYKMVVSMYEELLESQEA